MMSIRRATSWTPWGVLVAAHSALVSALGSTGCASVDPSIWERGDGTWRYDRTPLHAADPETLTAIDGHFAKDAVQAYYRSIPVPASDPTSFEVLTEHEARDRRAVYWGETYRNGQDYYTVKFARAERIPGADPTAYRLLTYDYCTDGKSAFTEGQPVKRDVRLLVGANAKALRPLGKEYATDGARIWCRGTALADVDLASLTPGERNAKLDARDVRGSFVRAKRAHPNNSP